MRYKYFVCVDCFSMLYASHWQNCIVLCFSSPFVSFLLPSFLLLSLLLYPFSIEKGLGQVLCPVLTRQNNNGN